MRYVGAMVIPFTVYGGGLYEIDRAEHKELTLEEFVDYFSVHLRLADKFQGPGFGPYILKAPDSTCNVHKDRWPRDNPHRCDSCVEAITFACFDVDSGTGEEIERCDKLLEDAGLARIWYTSYSYTPEKAKPPFRLIIFLSEPIKPEFWSTARRSIAAKFKVPCDIKQCSGLSHFYFLPACPPDAEPYFEFRQGSALDISTVPMVKDMTAPRPRVSLDDWSPPEEPPEGTRIDLEDLKNRLRKRQKQMAVSSDETNKNKGDLLKKVLAGEALAEHGNRNNAMSLASGIVAWVLPGQPLSVLMLLLRPSLQVMQAAGSSLTEDEVERMLLTAMQAKAEYDARQKLVNESLTTGLEQIRSKIPVL